MNTLTIFLCRTHDCLGILLGAFFEDEIITYFDLGYMFVEVIKSQLGHIEDIEKYILGVLLLPGISIIIGNRIKKRKESALEL